MYKIHFFFKFDISFTQLFIMFLILLAFTIHFVHHHFLISFFAVLYNFSYTCTRKILSNDCREKYKYTIAKDKQNRSHENCFQSLTLLIEFRRIFYNVVSKFNLINLILKILLFFILYFFSFF